MEVVGCCFCLRAHVEKSFDYGKRILTKFSEVWDPRADRYYATQFLAEPSTGAIAENICRFVAEL